MDEDNNPTAYEDLGPIQRSTCSDRQRQSLRPSAITRRIIAELGLRYRPANQADLEAHAGLLALLATDVAAVDPRDLDVAVRQHAAQSPFMPKACELLDLADNARAERELRDRPPLAALEYHQPELPEPVTPCTPEEAAAIMAEYGLGTEAREQVKRVLGSPRAPTREDYIAMGVDPGV